MNGFELVPLEHHLGQRRYPTRPLVVESRTAQRFKVGGESYLDQVAFREGILVYLDQRLGQGNRFESTVVEGIVPDVGNSLGKDDAAYGLFAVEGARLDIGHGTHIGPSALTGSSIVGTQIGQEFTILTPEIGIAGEVGTGNVQLLGSRVGNIFHLLNDQFAHDGALVVRGKDQHLDRSPYRSRVGWSCNCNLRGRLVDSHLIIAVRDALDRNRGVERIGQLIGHLGRSADPTVESHLSQPVTTRNKQQVELVAIIGQLDLLSATGQGKNQIIGIGNVNITEHGVAVLPGIAGSLSQLRPGLPLVVRNIPVTIGPNLQPRSDTLVSLVTRISFE